MPVYMYRAMTKTGQQVQNKVEDSNRFNLIRKIKRNGLLPISVTQINLGNKKQKVKKKRNDASANVLRRVNTAEINAKNSKHKITLKERIALVLSTSERIKIRDVMVFTQNFYLLKKANFNNIHALSTIIESTEKLSFKAILEDILSGLEAGENMYTTMEYYTGIFPPIYVNIVKVGELSGSLTSALEQAVAYLDESTSINKEVKNVLVPNLIQFFGILALTVIGTLIGVPLLQGVFEKVGSKDQLPEMTLWFFGVLKQIQAIWYIPFTIIVAGIIALVYYINTPKGKYNFHYFKYTMPVFGKLIYALDFERLMKAILINIRNGMRIQDALDVSKSVAKNYVMLSLVETSINNILIGQSWIEPFEKSGLSSPMITEMLKIGMQTDLSEMIEKLLEYMRIDIKEIIEKIRKVMPQIVTAIVGVVLIFFVIVVLVPIIQVYMGNFLFSAAGV